MPYSILKQFGISHSSIEFRPMKTGFF